MAHALLLLLPMYGLFMARPSPPPRAVEVRLARSETPVTDEPSPSQTTQLVAPELEEALEGVKSDAPFQEAQGQAVGAAVGAIDARAFGLDLGARSGQGRGGSGGPSAASEGALHKGLEWLARHQLRDGSWGPAPDTRRRRGDDCDNERAGLRRGRVGHTGLALLCFLAAKQGPNGSGAYRRRVDRAERWLIAQLSPKGGFALRRAPKQSLYYHHAIGTLALSESLSRRERPPLRAAVNQLVAFLSRTQGTFGWRYGGNGCDTSVVAWVILALKAAESAKVPVKRSIYVGPRRWLERVSTRDGRTGYQTRTARTGPGMSATGLFLRMLLGESVRADRNRLAAQRLASFEVDVDDQKRVGNLYATYYAALAMFQVGGRRWTAFNPRVRDALVASQSRARDCTEGSWRSRGWFRGRLLGTCFATLTLETYYRYLKTRDDSYERACKALRAVLERVDAVAASTDPATNDLEATERQLVRALAALVRQEANWTEVGDGRAALVRLAHLQQDETKAERYVSAYWRALPRGATPHALVVGARQLQRLQGALATFQDAADIAKAALAGDSPKRARDARWILVSESTRLRLAVARLRPPQAVRRRVRRVLTWSEETAAALTFHDVDTGIAEASERLARVAPVGRVGPLERRLLGELASRANLHLDIARADKDPQALESGANDLALIDARRPERLSPQERAALDPVLQRARLGHVAALAALRQLDPALSALDAFLRAPGDLAPQAHALLQRLLIAKVATGNASRRQRRRLLKLLAVDPDRTPPETVVMATVLGSLGEAKAGAALLAREQATLAADQDRSPFLIGRASLELQAGRATQALALLTQLPAEAQRRLQVSLLRGQILRARGNHTAAIVLYRDLLRGLRKQPSSWWRVAEEAARTYYQAGEAAAGRRFLESLRARDTAFGGRPGLLAMWHRKSWWRKPAPTRQPVGGRTGDEPLPASDPARSPRQPRRSGPPPRRTP